MSIGGKNLFSISQHHSPSRKQLRSFGLILAGGFLVIGLWPMVFRHHGATRWAIAVSIIFAAAGILIPNALRQAYRVWMTAGDLLGWINSKVILGALYYILMTPLRMIMTFAGHDPMNRKFDRNSTTYRVIRKPRSASHMTHQF
jgi:Saxitoxin biosynthesis operon protein SxtJ